jgi:hypothetical protein
MFSAIPNTTQEIEGLLRGTKVYPRSIQQAGGEVLCAVKDAHQFYLLAVFNPQLPPFLRDSFGGETQDLTETLAFKWCFPSHSNAKKLRALFPWTAPQNLENQPAFAVRDLIGLAAPAILQAHNENYDFALVFEAAPDEMNKLSRTMDEALDAVTFAVFQENYRRPWAMRAVRLQNETEAKIYRKLGYSDCLMKDKSRGQKQFLIDAAVWVPGRKDNELWQELHKATFGNRIHRMSADKHNQALFHTAWTAKTPTGAWQFRDRFYRLLLNNEALHFQFVREGVEKLFTKFQKKPKG